VPAFAAVQVADGPFVRSVYRDSSLRSYFLSAISREHLARGPWKMFFYEPKLGRMVDNTNSPGVLLSTALGMILNDRPEAASAALDAAHALGPPDRALDYVTGLVAFERGDSAVAAESFLRAGLNPVRGGSDVLRQVEAALARADTMTAAELLGRGTSLYSYEAKMHAKYSDVLLGRPGTRPDGQLEAYAARVLDPRDGLSWRRWGYVLANQNRHPEALAAFERYARLAPDAAAADERTREAVAILKRMLPGGDIAQRSLQRQLDR
jgi:tetratricopeptide (TPR) repeat protein